MRRGLVLAGATVLALTACSSAPQDEPPQPRTSPRPSPAPPLSTPRSPADACGAAELQRLVGRPRSEIPVPVLPSRQRVACTTCPVTQDFNASRLNFFFDADTGLIREIRCG